MDDLLNVAQQLESLNPGPPGAATARQGAQRGRQAPPPAQSGTAGDGRVRGVSSIRIEALLSKTLSKLDTHIVSALTRSTTSGHEEKLELALLNHLRKSLARHSGEVPKDVSVCESLQDVIAQTEHAFNDLASSRPVRFLALTAFLRERCSLARALGVASPAWIDTLKATRKSLESMAEEAEVPATIVDKLAEVRTALDQALEGKSKPTNLLESMLRS